MPLGQWQTREEQAFHRWRKTLRATLRRIFDGFGCSISSVSELILFFACRTDRAPSQQDYNVLFQEKDGTASAQHNAPS